MAMLASNTKYVQFLNVLNSDGFFGSIKDLVLSPWLDSLCVVTHQKEALLYLLPSIETCLEPLWQCPSKVERCLFSEDGKNILVILRVNSFQIYQVTDNNVSLMVQMKACELMKVFNHCNIEFSAASEVKALLFKKQNIILMMDKKLVVKIEWSSVKSPAVTYSIPVDMHRDVCLNDKLILVLNSAGLINIYSAVSGEVLNEVIAVSNEEPKLFKVRVHPSAAVMAGVNEAEETVLLDIKEVEGSGGRMGAEVRKEKGWGWAYKGGRKRTGCKGSGPLRKVGKVGAPLGLVVAQLQFSIRGLFVFYGILGQVKCSSLKVIEESSGSVLYSFEGLVESRVASGGPLPLVFSESILSVCLGAICRDDVVVKLCNVLWGVSKESEAGMDCRDWEGPFDFHWVFLKIVVRLHRNLFRWDLKRLPRRGEARGKMVTEGSYGRSKITERVCSLLKVVMEAKSDRGPIEAREAREKMLVECFVHVVGLLDVVLVEGGIAFDGDLFSELLHHVLVMFEDIRSLDPLRDDWANWREMTDVEVIREACAVGVPGLAHVFLVADRGWLGTEIESKFRKEAHVWVEELVRANNLEKAGRVLRNLGSDPVVHLKWLALNAKDPILRDILIEHLNSVGECGAEELEAWHVAKKVESAISSAVKRYHVFDQRMNVSAKNRVKAMAMKLPAYQGSIDLMTLLNCPQDWRDDLFSELYFHTGDAGLEKIINKRSCWQYLLRSNQLDLLKTWINTTGDPCHLDSLAKSFDYLKKKIHQLFVQWPVTEEMVNDVLETDCMTSTKSFVLDTCAFYGIFASQEKRCIKKLVCRLDNQSLLPHVRTVLSKATSNVNPDDFEDMVFQKCMSHELRSVALTCLEKPIPSDLLWVDTWKSFYCWAGAGESKKFLREAIAKCSDVYDCDSVVESSLLDVAVTLIDDKEISDVIESQGKECSLLRLPLMNVNWKSVDSADRRSPDVTLYELLKSSKMPTDELYLWQIQNKHEASSLGHVDVFAEFPHFNHQVLTIKFGFRQNLDHIYYLKQGRPSFACNLFVVESLRTQRRLTTKMVKRVCGIAHGLALRRWKDRFIGNGCVAFIAMLGDIAASNFLRIHLGAIQSIYEYLPEDMSHYISTLARGIATKHLPHLQEMASILERSIMVSADKKKMAVSMEKWSLAVSFCNIHSLPLPSLLLKNLARRHDWFSFMTCMDLFKYPYEQAIDLIEEITSKILKSHLIRAVTRTTLKLSTTSPTKSPPKILLEPESNGREDQEMVNGKDIKDTFQSFVTNIYTEILNTIQTFTDKNIVLPWSCEQDPDSDLLLTLLKCESEADTSKSLLTSSIELQSPALAVFATCFQCDNIFPNMMAWLVSSVPTSLSRLRRREEGQRLVDRVYGPKEVETLLLHFFSTGYFQTFFRGMTLFMSENPISLFLNAVYHSIVLLDLETGRELLKGFVLEMAHFPKETSGLFTRSLVLNIVAQCIENLLTRADLQNTTKRRFLRVLAESELSSVDSGFPNYLLWSQICEILECSEANLDFAQLYDLTTVTEEVQNCLDALMRNSQFSQALEICSLLSLNRDQFVVAMWKNQIEVSIRMGTNVEKVWKDSCSAFKDENVNPNLAASFYYDMASIHDLSSPESLMNRYLALKYCLHWRRFIEDTLSASFKEESDAIELDMWRCCIEDNFEITLLRNEEPFEMSQALGMSVWTFGKVLVPAQALEEVERKRVEYLINYFLDEGDLGRAIRLSAFFKSDNQDLMLITSCLKIIHEEVCPSDVSQLNAIRSVKASRTSSLRFEPTQDYELVQSNEQHRVLLLLDKLCQTVNHGKALAHKFFICYRLSVNMDLTLKDIASERDYLGILRRWVSLAGANQFNVASDLITLADLSSGELAKYLKEKIVSTIMEVHSTDLAVPSTLWGVSLESDFHLIIGLMNNPSTLGSELLQASTSLSCSHGVEVLIRAHDCFAACCNVEGIGRVLRRARILASVALQAGQWQHLVRLLIGIERYSDMSYIFQMLKDNGQFEQLLRKGMHKVPGLHVAISEFLQRHCPQDKELGKMVAAHFGLHSKLASFWQKEADEIIAQLPVVDNTLKDTSRTRDLLNFAVENYSHAAHWFLQAGKLNRALKVAHRAQIAAMQISLLGGPFILSLRSRADLQTLLHGSLSVAQTLIISRACDLDPDWISALHERWVLKGDKAFLSDLKSHSLFSSQLVSSYFLRYGMNTVANGKAKDRMKQITTGCSHTSSPMANDLKINRFKRVDHSK